MIDPEQPDRRRFLVRLGAWTAFAAFHESLGATTPHREPTPYTTHRILRLRLLTAAPLGEMKAFYHGMLGLRVTHEREDRVTFACGATRVTFARIPPDGGEPFYHFAFDIPESKIRQARAWQLERTGLLPVFPQLRDPAYPNDVVHFRNWNAHSVFFLDPAGNVVEYIARHDLDNATDGPFTPRDILYASEIAFVADDVPAMAASIKKTLGLDSYRPGSDAFHAVGDETGLLLVFRRGRNIGLAGERERRVGVFYTWAQVAGSELGQWVRKGYPYEIVRG